VTLLRFFLDGALRFHAAPCARVAYVHETVCTDVRSFGSIGC
jgi:hypothetical protein